MGQLYFIYLELLSNVIRVQPFGPELQGFQQTNLLQNWPWAVLFILGGTTTQLF